MRPTSKSIVTATVLVLLFSGWLPISRGEQPESLIVTVIHVDARPADTRPRTQRTQRTENFNRKDAKAAKTDFLQKATKETKGHNNLSCSGFRSPLPSRRLLLYKDPSFAAFASFLLDFLFFVSSVVRFVLRPVGELG
jgi:hypothetical protein